MVNFTILAGGYDVFIAAYSFFAEGSSLTLLNKYPTGPNPSWVTGHPLLKNTIYAVNENAQGALQSFLVDENGVLSHPFSTVPSGGDSPAFTVALTTGEVAVMNYGSGNGRIIPAVGPLLIDSAPNITFTPPPNGVSHPHMTLAFGNELFIPDLGADTIWRLGRDGLLGHYKVHGALPQPQGSGPRHIAIYGDRLFTLHELASTLTVQTIPSDPNTASPLIASVSIIPSDVPAGSKWAAAEILIPEPCDEFPTPYIYVSNRNTGTGLDPRGDTIAIFEHVNVGQPNEGLQLVKQVYTGLEQIRGMEFSPAPSEYLIASGVVGSGGVVMLCRTEQGRNLEIVTRNLDIPTRTSFHWLP